MKTLALRTLAAVLAAAPTQAVEPAAPAPRNLALELTVIRFKPESKEQVLQDFRFAGASSNIVDSLRSMGRSVDVVYRGTREMVIEPKSMAKFDATETRPVVLVGKPGVPMPPAAVYGLTLQVTVRPVSDDTFVLAWEGGLNWSPDLMDRRNGMQNTFQFLGKAANLAQSASQLAGESQGAVKSGADIGFAVAEMFRGGNGDSGIFELPVLKTVALNGSRTCRSGQLVVSTTAAEAGVKEPQILFFVLAPRLEP
ncbi:MAG: hypothetical protein DVB31_13825 [Verrucomicrobia bacterium]|nr:MAG: hypothetical protein DVB31_13825 [Verrucomicrobiota bacterium]